MTDNPCPSCVETRRAILEEIDDWMCDNVSITADVWRAFRVHFFRKSPAQQLAEECPHGMTVEQAQWVLDKYDDLAVIEAEQRRNTPLDEGEECHEHLPDRL